MIPCFATEILKGFDTMFVIAMHYVHGGHTGFARVESSNVSTCSARTMLLDLAEGCQGPPADCRDHTYMLSAEGLNAPRLAPRLGCASGKEVDTCEKCERKFYYAAKPVCLPCT